MHELKNPRLPGFQQKTRIPLCAQKRRCFRGPYPVDSTLHEEVLGPRPDAGGFVVLLKVNKLPRVGWAVVAPGSARVPPARPSGFWLPQGYYNRVGFFSGAVARSGPVYGCGRCYPKVSFVPRGGAGGIETLG